MSDLAKSVEISEVEKALGFKEYEERPARLVIAGDKVAFIAKNKKRVAVFEVKLVKEGWVVSDKTCYIKEMDDVIACLAARNGIDIMVLDNGTRLLVTFFSPIGRDDENGSYGPIYRLNLVMLRDVRVDGRRVTVTVRH